MFSNRARRDEASSRPGPEGPGRKLVGWSLLALVVAGCTPGKCGPCGKKAFLRQGYAPISVSAPEPGLGPGVPIEGPIGPYESYGSAPGSVVVEPESVTPYEIAPRRIEVEPGVREIVPRSERILPGQGRVIEPAAPPSPPLDSTKPDPADELSPLPETSTNDDGKPDPAAYSGIVTPSPRDATNRRGPRAPSPPPPDPLPPEVATQPERSPTDVDSPQPEASFATPSGLARFSAVEPDLAGGSVPDRHGLVWLSSLGYRTVLDLRDPGPDHAALIAEARAMGLRYVACPADVENVPLVALADFEAELDQQVARPLFFFDEGGRRAGALWYLHRKATHKLAEDRAREEAAELGLLDEVALVKLATALAPTPPVVEGVTPEPEPIDEELPAVTALPVAVFAPMPTSHVPPWRAMGALTLTLLMVPLAYAGRSALDSGRARLRASLRAIRSSP